MRININKQINYLLAYNKKITSLVIAISLLSALKNNRQVLCNYGCVFILAPSQYLKWSLIYSWCS